MPRSPRLSIGETLLWITVVGLAALTLWQIFETIWRRAPDEGRITKVFGRTGSSFSAAAYLTSVSARPGLLWWGMPPGTVGAPSQTQRPWRRLALRVFAVLAGAVLIVIAVRAIYRGARRRFVDDLKDSVSTRVIVLGQAGFIGKGITFAIIGVLMIVTGFDGRTGPPGLQAVLRLLNLSPAGGVLLRAQGDRPRAVRRVLLRLGGEPAALSSLPRFVVVPVGGVLPAGLDPGRLAGHLRVLRRIGQVALAVVGLVPFGHLQQPVQRVRLGVHRRVQVAHLGEPGRHGDHVEVVRHDVAAPRPSAAAPTPAPAGSPGPNRRTRWSGPGPSG